MEDFLGDLCTRGTRKGEPLKIAAITPRQDRLVALGREPQPKLSDLAHRSSRAGTDDGVNAFRRFVDQDDVYSGKIRLLLLLLLRDSRDRDTHTRTD